MTTAKLALFLVCAFFALAGAVGTVASRRPLRAAMALLMHILAPAGPYLTSLAPLPAAIQLLVYAGAIVVLFVFVIMLIGPASDASEGQGKGLIPRTLGLIGAVMFMAPLSFSLVSVASEWVVAPADYGSVEGVGTAIYRDALVPFEIVSITLLVAIVGAVAVARRSTPAEIAEKKKLRAESSATSEPAEKAA